MNTREAKPHAHTLGYPCRACAKRVTDFEVMTVWFPDLVPGHPLWGGNLYWFCSKACRQFYIENTESCEIALAKLLPKINFKKIRDAEARATASAQHTAQQGEAGTVYPSISSLHGCLKWCVEFIIQPAQAPEPALLYGSA